MIVMFHFDTTFPWMRELGLVTGWYLAVEFFFLVSGYLIYAKMDDYKKRYGGAIRFTLHRYRELFPKYIIAFALTFSAIHLQKKSDLSVTAHLVRSLPEVFLLQGIGIDRGWDWVNPTLWYLSVMLIAGFVMYLGLRYIRRIFVGYLAPALIIIFLFLLYQNVGTLDAAVMLPGEYANYPLFRGFTEMCLGMYACMLTGLIKGSKYARLWQTLGSLFMVAAIFTATFFGRSHLDFLVLLLLFLGVAWCFLPADNFMSKAPAVRGLSSITLEIYLLHEIFRTHIFPLLFSRDATLLSKLLYMVMYMAAVTLAAWLFHRAFLHRRSKPTDFDRS